MLSYNHVKHTHTRRQLRKGNTKWNEKKFQSHKAQQVKQFPTSQIKLV
jgi:hypothetical protein